MQIPKTINNNNPVALKAPQFPNAVELQVVNANVQSVAHIIPIKPIMIAIKDNNVSAANVQYNIFILIPQHIL